MPSTRRLPLRRLPEASLRARRRLVSALVASVALWGAVGAGAATPLTLSEASNHHTVTIVAGTTFSVKLHNTYWTLTPLPSTSALAQVGVTKVVGSLPSSSGCVPGQGCGTVSAHFVTRHAGYARLSATRTSCGEALRCTPASGHWTVVVHVIG